MTSLDALIGKPRKSGSLERVQQLPREAKEKKTTNQLAIEQFKKFMEETQRKTDREGHRRLTDGEARSKSKKQRSKSCNSAKGDLFSIDRDQPHAHGTREMREQKRDKSKESGDQTSLRRAQGQSCIEELNKLKNEINEEIRQERNL
jgi:hypothetical protein